MRTFRSCFLFLVFLFVSGCLTHRAVEFVIEFTDNFNSGKLMVTYLDIRSSDQDPEKREADFQELLELYEQDQFLLDQVREGVYVRERMLFSRGDTLIGRFTGIFEHFSLDGNVLDKKENERFLTLELSPQQSIHSDGNILRNGNNILLTWPAGQKKIWFRVTETDPDTARYSMIDNYRAWKK